MHVVDPIDEALGEVPLPPYVTAEDAKFAVRAAAVHAAEQWSSGRVCRNDGATHPCRLHRWGRRVLIVYGLSEAEVDGLVERGDPTAPVARRRGER